MSVNALHSAARRYCMERLDSLAAIHRYMTGERGPEQQSAWLAALALRGILPDIERISPRDVDGTTALRTLLVDRCSRARWPEGNTRQQADDEWEPAAAERARFRSYIARLTDEEAEHLPRVPVRRTLDAKQRRSFLSRVARAWPAGGDRWHPMSAMVASADVLALQSAWVGTEDLPFDPMRRVLAALAAGHHIWELHEGAPSWTTMSASTRGLKGRNALGDRSRPGTSSIQPCGGRPGGARPSGLRRGWTGCSTRITRLRCMSRGANSSVVSRKPGPTGIGVYGLHTSTQARRIRCSVGTYRDRRSSSGAR